MHFAKSQKLTISAIAVLALVSVFVAFFQTPQQAVNNPVAAKGQDGQGTTKRQWFWLSPPTPVLELIEVKNLDSDNWMEDLELRVKNKSEKPIYFIDFNVSVQGLKIVDATVAFDLRFGNPDLWHEDARPSADDKFLKPGEEVVLRVDEKIKGGIRKMFERVALDHQGVAPAIPKVAFYFYKTVLDDGTRYLGNKLVSGGIQKQSFNNPRQISGPQDGFRALPASFSFPGFGFVDAVKKDS